MRAIHFISGLPRAGSTLLAALLRQNPRFHAGISGPVSTFVTALLGQMSVSNEFALFLDETQKKAILKGVFENYYAAETDKIVFDTSRQWCAKMPVLAALFPQAKVIACVRHNGWIIDSVERLVRRNAFDQSKIFDANAGGTVYDRAEGLSAGSGLLGFAYNALKQAYYGEHSANLMVLRYEALTSRPAEAMSAVYDFIGEQPFAHDFDNVTFDAKEFDARLGTPGMHDVDHRVTPANRETILPPDVFERYRNDSFWDDPKLNIRGVRVV